MSPPLRPPLPPAPGPCHGVPRSKPALPKQWVPGGQQILVARGDVHSKLDPSPANPLCSPVLPGSVPLSSVGCPSLWLSSSLSLAALLVRWFFMAKSCKASPQMSALADPKALKPGIWCSPRGRASPGPKANQAHTCRAKTRGGYAKSGAIYAKVWLHAGAHGCEDSRIGHIP